MLRRPLLRLAPHIRPRTSDRILDHVDYERRQYNANEEAGDRDMHFVETWPEDDCLEKDDAER